jgi:translation initiation factor RLI1
MMDPANEHYVPDDVDKNADNMEKVQIKLQEMGVPKLNVSYKPQKISPKFEGTVRQLLHAK